MELRDYFLIIRKHKWIVLLVTLAVIAGYSAFFFTQQPTYSARARIVLSLPPEWRDMTVITMPSWQTRVQLIQSKPVARRTSRRLKQNGINLSPGVIQSGLNSRSHDETDFVDISYSSHSSTTALTVTRAVTKTFLNFDRENNLDSLTNAQNTLANQLDDVQEDLKRTEQKLAAFKRKHKIVSPDVQLSSSFKQLYKLNDRRLETTSRMETVNNKLRRFNQMLSEQQDLPDTQILQLEQTLIEATTKELSQARIELNSLKQQYGPKHPKMIETKNRIQGLKNELRSTVEDHMENLPLIQNQQLRKNILDLTFEKQLLRTEQKLIQERQKRIQNQIAQISSNQSRLAEFKRRLDFVEKRFGQLREKLDQVQFNKSLLDESGRIVSLPKGTSVSYPTTYRTYGFVLLAGLLFGISTGAFLEYINNKIETRFDVHRYLDLSVLGSIPEVDQEIELQKLPKKTPLTEQYHAISVRLQYSLLKKQDLRSVLLASSIRGEGKSATIMNLGVTLAREGEKVLLIDLDLRDPVIHKKFNLMNSNGASNILSGELQADHELESLDQSDENFEWSAVQSTIKSTEIDGLDVIPSGPIPSNPVQLLKSEYFDRLLTLATRNYGVVLLDSPPLYSVVDSVVMANRADGVLMISRSGMVTKGQAQHSTHLLEDTGAFVMGVILNGVSHQEETYYTYYRQTEDSNETLQST